MAWSYKLASDGHNGPAVHYLCRDGVEVGTVCLLPEAGYRVELLLQDIVHGLDNPVPLEERGFQGRAGAKISDLRARRGGPR